MPEILTDLSPSSLAIAIKTNLYAYFQSFRASSQVTTQEGSPGLRWYTAIPHPWFNGVLCDQPPGVGDDQAVQATIAYFHSKSVTSFTWWLAPHLDPAAWSPRLLPHGFVYNDQTPGMAVDLAALPPLGSPPINVQRVEDQEMLSVWTATFTRGYGIPPAITPVFLQLIASLGIDLPFRYYLGQLDGRPVAASTLFLGAGVAGIYNVATLLDARGRGIGSAMTLVPLLEARDLGYHAGVLQSSEMGYPVYQRLGFQKFCQMDHFYWEG